MPLVEEQPQREDRLRGLAEAHLVGEERAVPRHQERDAFELIRERLERHFELPAVEEAVERRLQEVEQPVLEEHRVGGRLRTDARLRGCLAVRQRRQLHLVPAGRRVGREPRAASVVRPAARGTSSPRCVIAQFEPPERPHPRRVGEQPRLADAGLERPSLSDLDQSGRGGSPPRRSRRRVRQASSSGGTVRSPPSCGPRRPPRGCARTARRDRPPDRRGRGSARHGVAVGRRTAPEAAARAAARGWSNAIGVRRAGLRPAARPPASRPATAGAGPPGCRSRSGRASWPVFSTSVLPIRSARRYSVQRRAVERGLHAVRLHRGREAELERPAPAVRHQIAAEPPGRFLEHGQEPERHRSTSASGS